MFNFVAGILIGIAVATVGFTGIANMADHGVHKVQEAIKDTARQ